jgi:hypothetical protein
MNNTSDDKLLKEILADEALLRPRLDVPVPADVLGRVSARMTKDLTHQRHSHVLQWLGSVAAVAACLVVAALLWWPVGPGPSAGPAPVAGLSHERAVEAFLSSPPTWENDATLALLGSQMTALARDLSQPSASPLQVQIDAMDQEVGLFWVDGLDEVDLETEF